MLRALSLVTTMAAALLFAGCPSFEKPSLSVLGAKVSKADFNGATVDVEVELDNPNAVPLFADSLNFAGTLEGKPLVTGEVKKRVVVNAKSKAKVTVPLRFVYRELGDVAKAAKDKARWRYAVDGTVGFAPIKEATFLVPFDTSGDLPAPRLPTVRAANARLEQPSLQRVTVAVDLVLKNPNAFAVPAGTFSGDIILGGKKTAISLKVPSTAAEKEQTVTLRQRVDLTDLVRVGLDIAAGKAVPATVDGDFAVGERKQPLRASITLKR